MTLTSIFNVKNSRKDQENKFKNVAITLNEHEQHIGPNIGSGINGGQDFKIKGKQQFSIKIPPGPPKGNNIPVLILRVIKVRITPINNMDKKIIIFLL